MKNVFNKILKTTAVIFLMCGTFVSHNCYATCTRNGGLFADNSISRSMVSLPEEIVIESRQYVSGEVLYTSGVHEGNNPQLTIANCGSGYKVGFFYNNSPQVEGATYSDVMPTNIEGIGVQVLVYNQAGPYDGQMTVDNSWRDGSGSRGDHTLRGSSYMIWLVATGAPISAGTLTFGSPVAQVEFRESASRSAAGVVASDLALSNADVIIKAVGCSADVSAISFPFGKVDLGQFDGQTKVGSVPTQDVNLSCEPGTNVSLSVTAAESKEDDVNHTVIALTGAGDEGVASGVGVQLGLKTSQYNSGSNGLQLNTPISLITSTRSSGKVTAGGATAQEKLTFSAVYYKTAAVVKPGKANATATLTLTYN
ncbi:type 1 fimbrial protein [Buttiauxella sp. A2-C1_F]|uniref:type 1 fimbrial protein n=1 Tax=unclassified Buttiauxella TaxID=2634062 RepID=UPI001E48C134|nr:MULTISPECIES: type 1 fimbrial protein [unclassified Buttiauxella]MCE0798788.1 type 1 fimbrial protein [Buttiauxella sp. W03-F01]MCE0811391.1 type 1 fimbrial protein [Buttiauxella sp. S04-F03]MCE0843994.1 type 1 fimbrial protein [Buttiauxella sp. A2-C1_F]